MRELNMDTQRQNFWTEAIIKEKTVALKHMEKHNAGAFKTLTNQIKNELDHFNTGPGGQSLLQEAGGEAHALFSQHKIFVYDSILFF